MNIYDVLKQFGDRFYVTIPDKAAAEQIMSLMLEHKCFEIEGSVTFRHFLGGRNVWPRIGRCLVVNKGSCVFTNEPGLYGYSAVFYDDFLGFLQNGGNKMHVSFDEFSAAFEALIE